MNVDSGQTVVLFFFLLQSSVNISNSMTSRPSFLNSTYLEFTLKKTDLVPVPVLDA